ncbi:hypothetical protein JL721_6002 [Aureococcus anophagefferens]|nr:hypothetical protein JL721_6002 [Aureococcus anophagefferens]
MEVGGGATTETPKRRIDAQHDQAPVNRGFWQSVGWGGVGSGLVFAVVGAILVYSGCNGFQLYAFSRKNVSEWKKKKVDTWRSAGFDTTEIYYEYEYKLDLPRSDFDFEHSDNYKYARLVQWYDYENADTLVGACVYLLLGVISLKVAYGVKLLCFEMSFDWRFQGNGAVERWEDDWSWAAFGNALESLPESFGDLSSLVSLAVSHNALTSLPESFGGLESLDELFLEDNALTSLPESFGALASLDELHLHDNALVSLPESFGGLESLVTLMLNHNALTSLPESFGDFESLAMLYLQDNALASLPESFGNLASLVTLELRNNANLSSLPASFLELSHLEPVSLAGTAICANGGAPALDSAFDDLIEAGVIFCEVVCLPTCATALRVTLLV